MNQQLHKQTSEGYCAPLSRATRPRILIIDDDVDASVPIQFMLLELGFYVEMSADPRQAKKLLCSGNWDLIILDWLLDVNVTAAEILEESDKFINKIKKLHLERVVNPSPIISFSVLPKGEVFVPESDHFFHLTHWEKPINYQTVLQKILNLLPYLHSRSKGGA